LKQNYQRPVGLWLDIPSVMQLGSTTTFARALELYRNQRVLSIELTPVADGWLLEGEVQGSQRQPYRVDIDFTRGANGHVLNWDSDCTCPVGYQCKHALAVLLKAAYKGHQMVAQSDSEPGQARAYTPEELARLKEEELERQRAAEEREAENQLLHWLGELSRSGNPATASAALPSVNRWGEPTKTRPEQFLYLLSVTNPQGPSPQLSVEVVTAYPKLSGGWSKARVIKFQPERGQPIFDNASDADHDILQLMRAMPSGVNYYYNYNTRSKVTLDGKYGVQILQTAAATERLFVVASGNQPGTPVHWGPALPLHWDWHERSDVKSGTANWALRAQLGDIEAKLCLNNPPLYLDSQLGQCGMVDLQGMQQSQLVALLKAPAMPAQTLKKHQPELMAQLGAVPLPPVLEPLPTLSGVVPAPSLHLRRVSADQVAIFGLVQAQLQFDYAGHRGWWVGQGATVVVNGPQGRTLLQRDPQAELEAMVELRQMGWTSDSHGVFYIGGAHSQQTWFDLLETDFAALRAAGFAITQDDSLQGWIRHAETINVNLAAHGDDEAASPWFDLSLGMEINGERHNILPWLPELIAAAANSPRDETTGLPDIAPFIYLSDAEGGFVRLPTDNIKPWLGALLELVGERGHQVDGESLRLSRFDALRATASLGEGVVWSGAQQLRDMVQQLKGHAELPDIALPASVKAELRPYQKQGVNWLQFLHQHKLAGILADDMGLGKTLQTLAHIQIEKDAGRLTLPALIIAPVSLMGNWKREAERFCPELRSMVHHGQDRHDAADSMVEHDIVIAPYSLLHRDRQHWQQTKWHLVVLDEAQNIKNANTHAAEVVSELNTRHRLCLSGTPMENNLGELWSLFHFLMPGFLGSQKRFTELYRKPIEKYGDPEATRQLRARFTPFMLRRTKAVVAHELPPKVETVMRVELSGKQADLYETIRLGMEKTVRDALNSKGLAKSQITILDALLKLRQVCCDPNLVKLDAARKVKNSAKLEQLMQILPEMLAEGRRILLFSQFTSMLTLIEQELKKRDIQWVKLTGQSQKRDDIISQFTGGAVPLFLISLKAGGTGLNLPQADTVIHYDPWWNPAVETQATDRAHRIGQTQSVWVVKLVAQGTIEERILGLQERKAALAESMYSGAVGRKQPLFSESDLAELLKPLAA